MIFITGTGTGCGKTLVGRLIAKAFLLRGISPSVYKPIETGCPFVGSTLFPEDAELLRIASQSNQTLEEVCPIRFELPASPERAAAAVGRKITKSELLESWTQVKNSSQVVLVEGAGGVLVPINSDVMMIDLPLMYDLPVILVSQDVLGTVNHTLLTLEALRSRGATIIGFVINHGESSSAHLENSAAISKYSNVRLLGHLPYLENIDDRRLEEVAQSFIDIDLILDHLPLRS